MVDDIEHLKKLREGLRMGAEALDGLIASAQSPVTPSPPTTPVAPQEKTPINPNLALVWSDTHCGVAKDAGRLQRRDDHVRIVLNKGDHIGSKVIWSDCTGDTAPVEAVAQMDWLWPDNFPTQKMQSAKYFGLQFGATAGGGLVGGKKVTNPNARENPHLSTGWSARVVGGKRHVSDSFRGYLYDAGRHGNDDRNWRPDQNKLYGDTVFGEIGKPRVERWCTIAIRYIANSDGRNDGVFELWVNGSRIIREDDRLWSMEPMKHPKMQFVISHMWGGTPSKSPVPWDTYNLIRNGKVWARFG